MELNAGETKDVVITCPIEKLKYYDVTTGDFKLESMEYEVYIGSSSANEDLIVGHIAL